MRTRAAVALEAGKPLEVMEVELEGPRASEVLVEVKATGLCHTDEFTRSGADPEGIFPSILGHEGAGIVRELGNENIDVINYTTNSQLLITRALSPAKVMSVKIDDETKRAEVMLKPEEVSKAIGRGGHNIRLAGQLTGYEIDVYREGVEEDVELTEFSDEIEDWIIAEFSKIGLDTAKSILEQDVEDLVRRTDLEEETIADVMRILREEFE